VKTIGTLCTGFGGVDVGAKAAGLELAWGVEYDPKLAEVGNFNLGNHIRVANILDCDPHDFERVNVFHASLPCTRASVANSSAELNEDGLKESPLDIAMADKTIEFINTLQPEIVTLENVWAWRNFQSWRGGKKTKGIQQSLFDAGYWLHVDHVNCADYSVPQTRKRMIVRAIRGGFVPYLPEPEPWIGWYEAIADLIPTLPDSQFAPWQLARLPEEYRTMLVAQGAYGNTLVTVDECEPSFTITANSNQSGLKAWMINGENAGQVWGGAKFSNEPAFTITAGTQPKGFIVDCQNAGSASVKERCLTIRQASDPMFTLTSSMGVKRPTRACIQPGRVVSMTPRCLARFQSFPDTYVLPEGKTLAAKGIGNAVPPLLMEKIYRGLSI